MSLFEKILKIYPSLKESDFHPVFGSIMIQDDSDGRGQYISKWDHPSLQIPTNEQLENI
jgi:hypothetical protein